MVDIYQQGSTIQVLEPSKWDRENQILRQELMLHEICKDGESWLAETCRDIRLFVIHRKNGNDYFRQQLSAPGIDHEPILARSTYCRFEDLEESSMEDFHTVYRKSTGVIVWAALDLHEHKKCDSIIVWLKFLQMVCSLDEWPSLLMSGSAVLVDKCCQSTGVLARLS